MIGISTSYFAMNKYKIFDSVARAVELDFQYIELGAAHDYEENLWQTIEKIAELYPQITFTVHGLFPPALEKEWFNASLGLTPPNKEIIDNMFKAAKIVNAKIVSIHPGFLNKLSWGRDYYGMNNPVLQEKIPQETAMKGLEEILSYSLEKARVLKIKFAIENIDKSNTLPLLQRKKDFDEIFKKFPELCLLFDYGHALSDKTFKEFLQLGDKMCEIHLHASLDKIPHHLVEKEDLMNISKIKRLNEIPIILEHNTSVTIDELLLEKEMIEKTMKL